MPAMQPDSRASMASYHCQPTELLTCQLQDMCQAVIIKRRRATHAEVVQVAQRAQRGQPRAHGY